MPETCDLCGRAFSRASVVPAFYPHKNVCRRRRCRDAADDAVLYQAPSRYHDLAVEIARRQERAQAVQVGVRQDAIARMDYRDEDSWVLSVVRNTELPRGEA